MSVLELLTKQDKFTEARVDELETEMLKMPQVSCPVTHRFGPGLYIREVHLPAGSLVVGHRQKFEHQNVFLKGRVTVLNEDGSATELKAPLVFVGKPGRKIGFVHEDVVWLNLYPTDETDVETLEATYLDKSENWQLDQKMRRRMKLLEGNVDQLDFLEACKELGTTPEEVRRQSELTGDRQELPKGAYMFKIGHSPIEGRGIFATGDFQAGDLIAPARILGKRTVVGRYTNHSGKPNAEMHSVGEDIYLFALRNIEGCKGGQDGEEITVNYRDAVRTNLQLREKTCQA